MSKAANIYWGKPQPAKRPSGNAARQAAQRRRTPLWVSSLLAFLMFSFVFVAMTYRSFTDLREEAGQNVILNNKLQSLMDENLALQEEIHTLKTDKTAIERQASKIGLDLKTQTSSVPSK